MEKLPSTFLHLFQNKTILQTIANGPLWSIVGENGAIGRRLSLSFFCVEYYTTDIEPVLAPFRGLRFVIWNRVFKNNIPNKWILFPFQTSHCINAFIDMRDIQNYYKLWNSTHKTYYNHFYTQKEYVVIDVSSSDYVDYYKKYSDPVVNIEKNCLYLDTMYHLDNKNLHCYFLKNIKTKEIVSGFAGADFFSVSQSYYFSAFTRKAIAPKESGVWLINYWIQESSEKGLMFANLGPIWSKGQAESWKGFSAFKMKFNPILLILPKELIRFTFSLHKTK